MSSNQITQTFRKTFERLSGRAMARIGLRMMPTFPLPSLKLRTVGFPQYRLQGQPVRCDLPIRHASPLAKIDPLLLAGNDPG